VESRRFLASCAIRSWACTVLSSVTCAACIGAAASQTVPGESPFGAPASFRVDKKALRAQGPSSALIEKVDASPFRYFRLLARQFNARTCFAFNDLRWRLPAAAVHGDAHIEQFVVTERSYGLEDFDQAGFGPAVVDLVRFAASIHVACRTAPWACNGDEAVQAYFAAYRAALEQPVDRTQPAIVERLMRWRWMRRGNSPDISGRNSRTGAGADRPRRQPRGIRDRASARGRDSRRPGDVHRAQSRHRAGAVPQVRPSGRCRGGRDDLVATPLPSGRLGVAV
jgi:hypothetical protein